MNFCLFFYYSQKKPYIICGNFDFTDQLLNLVPASIYSNRVMLQIKCVFLTLQNHQYQCNSCQHQN